MRLEKAAKKRVVFLEMAEQVKVEMQFRTMLLFVESCTSDRFRNGSVGIDSNGNLQNVSVNSQGGKSLEELTVGIPHNKVGVTTVGEVRKAGGNVIPDPNKNNPFHAILEGITPEQAEVLMTPTVKNPNAK